MEKVYVMAAGGVEEVEAMTVIDFLRRADIDVESVAAPGEDLEIKGAHGIRFYADRLFSEELFSDCDLIVLPGGMGAMKSFAGSEELRKVLEDLRRRGKTITAICASPSVLGKFGLLRGYRATVYRGMQDALEGAEYVDEPVVVDRDVITGRGPGAATDFALAIIEYLRGKEVRDSVEAGLLRP